MRPYFKFMVNNKRKKYLKDRKLRPIKIRDFNIQPVIINPLRRDHRFRYDSYVIPVSDSIKRQLAIKYKQTKIFYARTTLSSLEDIIELSLEDIYYLTKPKCLMSIWLNDLSKG